MLNFLEIIRLAHETLQIWWHLNWYFRSVSAKWHFMTVNSKTIGKFTDRSFLSELKQMFCLTDWIALIFNIMQPYLLIFRLHNEAGTLFPLGFYTRILLYDWWYVCAFYSLVSCLSWCHVFFYLLHYWLASMASVACFFPFMQKNHDSILRL